jgi:hypothetical protein
MKVQILGNKKSQELRSRYLKSFINVSGEYYQRNINHKIKFSDGIHHTGYLWDCLREKKCISFSEFQTDICSAKEVYVLADDLSRDKVLNGPLWPWPADSVIELSPDKLLLLLDALPEDLYVFDSQIKWTRIITHEYDDQKRICLAAGSI